MTISKAVEIQKQIEGILEKNDIHYEVEKVKRPDLRFINIHISLKVTK